MNDFEENNSMFSINGVINRRNFLVNYLISVLVGLLIFSTPMFYLTLFNTKFMTTIMQSLANGSTNGFSGLPLGFILWAMLAGFVKIGILAPSIIKRLRDITEREDINIYFIITITMMCLGIIPCKFAIVSQLLVGINLFIILYLLFTKGQITGRKPSVEIVKFNWGAMFGTWVWGLINKSYITLLAIPLFFSCGGFFIFALICGLKGNEWAYSKQKSVGIGDFHKNQSLQTVWFSVCIPILSVAFAIISFLFGSVVLYKYFQKNPTALKAMENYSSQMVKSTVESRYDNIEFTKTEYKFYLSPVVWDNLPTKAKKNLFMTTENYVYTKFANINNKPSNNEGSNEKYLIESNKIKIYSSFNNELLAERNVDIDKYKDLVARYNKKSIPLKELLGVVNGGYSFNEHPTLP